MVQPKHPSQAAMAPWDASWRFGRPPFGTEEFVPPKRVTASHAASEGGTEDGTARFKTCPKTGSNGSLRQ